MPSFATDTVHGLSADVYYKGSAVRIFGDISLSVTEERLDLTANDEGNVNPVDSLRRGDALTVTIPISDTDGLPTLSGVVFPFSDGSEDTSVSGASGKEVMLPKAQPGDSYLAKAGELRLVTRDGSATWIMEKAVPTERGEMVMSEESQRVFPTTFTCYRFTHSGAETPFYVVSGSHTP